MLWRDVVQGKAETRVREWMEYGIIINSFAMARGQEDGIAEKQVNQVKMR